jgi:hypothetical protein
MKKALLFKSSLLSVFLCLISLSTANAQVPRDRSFVKDMRWSEDNRIYITMFNDSTYIIKVDDMIHSKAASDSTSKDFVYYPVMLARNFLDKLKDNANSQTKFKPENNPPKIMTLWSALHISLGGGWVHFVNCLLYSLETKRLSLTAPLMTRPKSSWKPNPITKTYKRTHKWEYYVPVDQKQAQKEYQLRVSENQLTDLHDVPADFIKLFLETNNRAYQQMITNHDIQKQARVDLVKLLLGSSYLSEPQISYIKSMVQTAVLQYSYNQLPTVIIFDDLNAAVVMSLNETGYDLEKIVLRDSQDLTLDEKVERENQIELMISSINKVNQKVFEEKLKKYYQ